MCMSNILHCPCNLHVLPGKNSFCIWVCMNVPERRMKIWNQLPSVILHRQHASRANRLSPTKIHSRDISDGKNQQRGQQRRPRIKQIWAIMCLNQSALRLCFRGRATAVCGCQRGRGSAAECGTGGFRNMWKLKGRPGGSADGMPTEECICQRWTCPVGFSPGMCLASQLRVSGSGGPGAAGVCWCVFTVAKAFYETMPARFI